MASRHVPALTAAEVEHSPLGGSSAHIWMECHAAPSLWEGESDSNAAARRGTALHEVMRHLVASLANPDIEHAPSDYLGCVVTICDIDLHLVDEYVVTEDDVAQIRFALNVVEPLVDGAEWEVEVRVDLDHYEASLKAIWGYVDFYAFRKGILRIVDYKFGRGRVHATGPQMPFYALPLVVELAKMGHTINKLEVIIVQPALEVVDSNTFTLDEHRAFGLEVVDAVAGVRSASPKFKPGSHCTWCVGRAHCPALRNEVVSSFPIEKAEDEIENALITAQVFANPEELAEYLDLADKVSAFVSGVRAHALSVAARGVLIPGRKLVVSRRNVKWNVSERNVIAALRGLGVAEKHFTKSKLMTPLQVEKATGLDLDELVKEAPSYSVVLESDKRPAANPPGVLNFDDEDDGEAPE